MTILEGGTRQRGGLDKGFYGNSNSLKKNKEKEEEKERIDTELNKQKVEPENDEMRLIFNGRISTKKRERYF